MGVFKLLELWTFFFFLEEKPKVGVGEEEIGEKDNFLVTSVVFPVVFPVVFL